MYKKRFVKVLGWVLLIALVIIFGYGIINYQLLENEMTAAVATGGLVAVFILAFVFESLPFFIGPSTTVFAAILAGLDLKYTLILFFIATTISAFLTYFLGLKSTDYMRKFIEAEKMDKYDKLWSKHGRWAMVIAAVSPVPYIPALAGIFRMKPKYFTFVVTPFRILRHLVVIWIAVWVLGLI